ncbi:CBS domain-containing protein [Streptomyces humi]|uniref:CBS domain-containing protein n=1 Tax=Streptomyces humi TaxID=1428620 RepID=UPI0006287A9D|nr:CBS domain-containing protein [Streptomyces humi]
MHGTPHTVSDVMTTTVVSVGREAPFKELVRLMRDWRISALPVVEGEGRVVGVVSEADLLHEEEFRDGDQDGSAQPPRLHGPAERAGALTAGELMTSPAVTVHADATLAQAARIMARSRVKRLPVADAVGVLQGVVSRADLLKVFLRDDEEIAEEVRRDIVSQLFPFCGSALRVDVHDGVVTLAGRIPDTSLVPVAARLVRAVEGVVDVDFGLSPNTAPAPAAEPASGAGRP